MISNDIRTAIKAVLDSYKGEGKPLIDVFDEHCVGFSGYPSVMFEPGKIDSEFETNQQNLDHYEYILVIHQEIEKVGRSEAIGILNDITDTLRAEFSKEDFLSDVVDWVNAVSSEPDIYDEGAGKVMYRLIKLVCNKAVSIN